MSQGLLTPVILSGGSGTRLWPLSREAYPKQFLSLVSGNSLLAETINRLKALGPTASPIVVSNEEHRFIIAATLQQCFSEPEGEILLEPVGRNTAPAIALAALQALDREPGAVLLVLPSDHVVKNVAAFAKAVEAGFGAAMEGHMVTFGIVPDTPQTGYGYIKAAAGLNARPGVNELSGWARVDQFVEKPDLETARGYVESGHYLWNSGMFMFRADRYLEELEKFRPDILQACRAAYAQKTQDLDFIRIDKEIFSECPSDSIDYAVMEQTDAAVVVPLDAGWSDVGSWSALWEIQAQDAQGNVCKGDVITEDASGCYLHSDSRLVAVLGMRDCVIVETDDVVLVADKDRVQDVKKLVARVKEQDRPEHRFHKKVHRPWGTYEGIAMSERFQVKRIVIKPGGRLSLQKHHHRAEHWVVVKGTAKVTRGVDEILLTEDQSTYIPLGVIHRLENPGVIPLELIEVQTGAYLGEDDIVRYEDTYGRS